MVGCMEVVNIVAKKQTINEDGQIQALEHIEAIRARPQMFVGELDAGCDQLLIELIDNSRDECLCGCSNKMEVFSEVDKDNNKWFVVRDWGRGIPLTSTKMPGKDVPIEISTKLFSGGKFTSGLYSFSSGLHGVGITLVNALSTKFQIITKGNDTNYFQYLFENGKFIEKKASPPHSYDSSNPSFFSTEIRFTPDPKYFPILDVNTNNIFHLLSIAKYGLEDSVKIFYENKEVLDTLLESFIKGSESVVSDSFIHPKTKEECKIHIAFYNDFDSGKTFSGVVNLLDTNEGTHKAFFESILKDKLYEISQKTKKCVQPNDLLVPIKSLMILKIKNPAFPAQVKGKLATKREFLQPLIEPTVINLIKKNQDFFNQVIDAAEVYRVNLETTRTTKKASYGKVIKVSGLKDCSSRDRESCSVFLVEGLSAGSTFVKCRDSRTDAILALRGKLLNVISKKASKAKILENQVIMNIAMSLGYKPFAPIDPDKCRYGKIILTADADPDGSHICCLLINVFYQLFPELIKAGKVFIAKMPLYGTRIKNKFVPIFTDKDLELYKDKVIQRFKGLGEMDADELYDSAINKETRRCYALQWKDFDMLKLWEEELGVLQEKRYEVTIN